MLNSFIQTVATPLKNTGLLAPSNTSANGVIVTNEPLPSMSDEGGRVGYMTFVVGENIADILPWPCLSSSASRVFSIAISASQVRGYVDKSSLTPNCVGF